MTAEAVRDAATVVKKVLNLTTGSAVPHCSGKSVYEVEQQLSRLRSRTIGNILCTAFPETRLAPTQANPQNETFLPQDFETALAQLEALVAVMEDGSLPLEESLASYRRGVELTRICQERLAQAEQQVRILEGDLLRPLDPRALDDESNG
jgi:exodeoxyribonuclease VII small subunit